MKASKRTRYAKKDLKESVRYIRSVAAELDDVTMGQLIVQCVEKFRALKKSRHLPKKYEKLKVSEFRAHLRHIVAQKQKKYVRRTIKAMKYVAGISARWS